jgi:hypothetical protein
LGVIKVREKIKGSGVWWIFIRYDGKRKSKIIGPKWKAQAVARKIKDKMFWPQKRKRKSKRTPMERLNRNISGSLRKALKGNKNRKRWETLVGYTLKDLMDHLEKQFTEGMIWDNYGEWHIDHIRPICSFDFTEPEDEDFKECWELSNLQPLWAKENLEKGSKLPEAISALYMHPGGSENVQPFEIVGNII